MSARALDMRPVEPTLADAKAYVVLADAAALADDPGPLQAFAAAFAADDNVTLVLHAPGWDDETTAEQLAVALTASGLDGDTGPDLLALPDPERVIDPRELVRGADASLGAAGAWEGGPPGYAPGEMELLRAAMDEALAYVTPPERPDGDGGRPRRRR